MKHSVLNRSTLKVRLGVLSVGKEGIIIGDPCIFEDGGGLKVPLPEGEYAVYAVWDHSMISALERGERPDGMLIISDLDAFVSLTPMATPLGVDSGSLAVRDAAAVWSYKVDLDFESPGDDYSRAANISLYAPLACGPFFLADNLPVGRDNAKIILRYGRYSAFISSTNGDGSYSWSAVNEMSTGVLKGVLLDWSDFENEKEDC